MLVGAPLLAHDRRTIGMTLLIPVSNWLTGLRNREQV